MKKVITVTMVAAVMAAGMAWAKEPPKMKTPAAAAGFQGP